MIFYYLFIILVGIVLLKKKEDSIVLLPVINVILDSSFTFFPSLSIVTYIRPAVFIILFLLIIKRFSFNAFTKPLYIFLIYTFILVLFSSQIFYSFKGYMQVFISMMTFVASFIYFDNESKLDSLNRSVLFLMVFSVIAAAVGYIFGIGRVLEYTAELDQERIGLLGSSGLYSAAVALSIMPMVIQTFRQPFWKWVLYISSVVVYIFILLNVRRTAIVIPIIGLLTFAWFTTRKSRVISGIIIAMGILIALSPLYQDKLLQRFQIREERGRFDKDFYKTEGRYLENVALLSEVFSFENPVKSFFGSTIYASGREEVGGSSRGRMYHSDPAGLLAGTGIIGLLLYIYFYYGLVRLTKIFRYNKAPRIKLFKATYLSLLFVSLFASLNGSIMVVSLRSLIFIYMGAMLSLSYHQGIASGNIEQSLSSSNEAPADIHI